MREIILEGPIGEFLARLHESKNHDGKQVYEGLTKLPEELYSAFLSALNEQAEADPDTLAHQFLNLPPSSTEDAQLDVHDLDILEHIDGMWRKLVRYTPETTDEDPTLEELPHPYLIPGDRFGEAYYWDSYFTARGLAATGQWEVVENMLDNFTYQIDKYGFVPNGNRTYYHDEGIDVEGRSQIPFYSNMVNLVADHRYEQALRLGEDIAQQVRNDVLTAHLTPMQQEYQFWMKGSDKLSDDNKEEAFGRTVKMPSGEILNRYYDGDKPRIESYGADKRTAEKAALEKGRKPEDVYRDIRAAAESGHDFGKRWWPDGEGMHDIETTNIVPVDLNSQIYGLESSIADALEAKGDMNGAHAFRDKAEKRAAAINKYCWDEKKGYYFDYHIKKREHTNYPTMAGVFPLWSGIASPKQAIGIEKILKKEFLREGGFATSLEETGEQWDGENGWAPMQIVAIRGLERYGRDELATEAAERWVTRTEEVYEKTRSFHEKLRVGKVATAGYGGEYKPQEGFGWSIGGYYEAKRKITSSEVDLLS